MTDPTRFPGGVTNANTNTAYANMGLLDPSKFHSYDNDFDTYNSSDWIVTVVEAGGGSAVQSLVDRDGGLLAIDNDDADNDSTFLQLFAEGFQFESGKKLSFKARFELSGASDAEQNAVIIGLQITDSTPLDASDGVIFKKDIGDAQIDFQVTKDSVSSSADSIYTVSNDELIEVSFFYDGVDKIDYFINNERLGALDTTNLPDDEVLTISFGIENGTSNQSSMGVDYIFVAKER